MKLLEAVFTAHKLKSKPLDVVNHDSFFSYSPRKDSGWLEYKRARDEIYRYNTIYRLLSYFRFI